MQKVALVAFRGEAMCFIHVLLNALDMEEKGLEARIVIEGAATQLIPEMAKPEHFLHKLYQKAWDKGLIYGACKACSKQMQVLKQVQAQGIKLLDSMNGHPSLAELIQREFQIITM